MCCENPIKSVTFFVAHVLIDIKNFWLEIWIPYFAQKIFYDIGQTDNIETYIFTNQIPRGLKPSCQ